MIDAYTIGITLALEDGVSAGIATIRQELATLDRAISSTAADLRSLRRLGQQASFVTGDHLQSAPANVPPQRRSAPAAVTSTPPISSVAAGPSTPMADGPGRPPESARTIAAAPVARPSQPPSILVQPILPPVAGIHAPVAQPDGQRLQDAVGRTQPKSALEFAPFGHHTPILAAPTPPQAGEPPRPAQSARMGESPASPVDPPQVDLPRSRPDRAIAPPAAHSSQNGPARRWSDYAGSLRPSAVQPEIPPKVAPKYAREDHVPQAEAAPLTNRRPAPMAPRPLPHRVAAANAGSPMPRVQDAAEQHSRRLAPPTRGEAPGANLSGDILLEGSRLGRWMADSLARMTERPPSGATGIDPRTTASWPGLHSD